MVLLRRMLAVEVQRNNQEGLDKQGGIVRLNDDDSPLAHGDHLRMPDR